MKYKVGDRVKIKSLDWYNRYTNGTEVDCGAYPFTSYMKEFCGQERIIANVCQECYVLLGIDDKFVWTDEMIEGLVEEVTKPEPKFKVGDKIISDVFSTKDDKGWKVIDVERTGYKLISVNNSDLICDMDFKNEHYYKLVENEMKSEDELLDEYEELTDRAFKGGYEKCKSDIELNGFQLPDGYIFKDENGNVINATKIVLEKKKSYPKTYEECCMVLGYSGNYNMILTTDVDNKLFNALYRLKVCRDAYWKIYGEENKLGKPWEPNWSIYEHKFCLGTDKDKVIEERVTTGNRILAFPTPEMRDAFYENFKSEIESCKEFL